MKPAPLASQPPLRPARHDEARALAVLLRSSRLTLLCGADGPERTRLLRDGLLPLLHRRASDLPASTGARSTSVLSFPDRRRAAPPGATVAAVEVALMLSSGLPLPGLLAELNDQLAAAFGLTPTQAGASGPSLASRLQALGERFGARFLIVCDRFEDALRAQAHDPALQAFLGELADAVSAEPGPTHVLLSVADDAEALLAAYRLRFPGCDSAPLRLSHWDPSATLDTPAGRARATVRLVPPPAPDVFEQDWAASIDSVLARVASQARSESLRPDAAGDEPTIPFAFAFAPAAVPPEPADADGMIRLDLDLLKPAEPAEPAEPAAPPQPPEPAEPTAATPPRAAVNTAWWAAPALAAALMTWWLWPAPAPQAPPAPLARVAPPPPEPKPAAAPVAAPLPPPRVAAEPASRLAEDLTRWAGIPVIPLAPALPGAGPQRLHLLRYDALQAARAGPAGASLRLLTPLVAEQVHFITRADSPLAQVHEIEAARVNVGPADSARALTARSVYQRLFEHPLPVAQASTLPLDAALQELLTTRNIDVLVLTDAQPSAWLAGLPPAQKAAIKLLPLAPGHPASQRALRDYLPATLRSGGGAALPALSVMSFLAASGAEAASLATVAATLCRQQAALQRDGHPAWRALRPGQSLPVQGFPYARDAASAFAQCASTPSAGSS